jgi:small-conductance mechanosensitive channel
MDIQQAINLTIFKQFKEKDIQFAYPTQTLFIENDLSSLVDHPAAKTVADIRNTAI